jgi:Histidine kinase
MASDDVFFIRKIWILENLRYESILISILFEEIHIGKTKEAWIFCGLAPMWSADRQPPQFPFSTSDPRFGAMDLAIVEQVRDRDEQARAAALAEARALQARVNPHFLFNVLNALAALATGCAASWAAERRKFGQSTGAIIVVDGGSTLV